MEMKVMKIVLLAMLLTMLMASAFNVRSASSEPSDQPATEWSQTYGGVNEDHAYSVVQTSDGGYALAGVTTSFGAGGYDFFLVKTDAYGNVEWTKTYGGTREDWADAMIQTSDGGYALAGLTWSFGDGNGDFWLVKTDSNGNMQWSNTYGGASIDRAWALVQTSDGGYVLVGETYSFGAGDWDVWLVKTDASGNMQWSNTYGGEALEMANGVVQTSDGGYAIAGRTESFGAGYRDYWLVKTDASGNMQWNKTYGGADLDEAYSLIQTDDGGYALVGYCASFGAGGGDNWLVKTDASGNIQWNKTYGGVNGDQAFDIFQTGDAGYMMLGSATSFGAGDNDFWLIKTDSSGNMRWNETYGGAAYDVGRSMAQTEDGGYALAGEERSFGAGNSDFWLIKLAPEEIPPAVSATVNVDPGTLNLRSKGQWITVYIQLPESYSAADIDATTILLNETIPPVLDTKYDFVTNPSEYLVDNNDGILERMVKFDRASVESFIYNQGIHSSSVALTITGKLLDGTPFEGTDIIFIVLGGSGGRRK